MFRKPIFIACFAVLLTTAVVGGAAIQSSGITAEAANSAQTAGGETVNATFVVSNERAGGQSRNLSVRVVSVSSELNVTDPRTTIDSLGANNSTRVSFPIHVPAETAGGDYSVTIGVFQGEQQVANATGTVVVDLETTDTESSSNSDDSSSDNPTDTESADGGGGGIFDETKDSWWYELTSGFLDGSEGGWFELDWDWSDIF